MSDLFYRAFEDRYRGSRATIRARQMAYLPFLQPLVAGGPGALALDLGCGRGEWLELTGELGFDATGIDLDDGMLAACRERGLKVHTADALSALRAAPANSLALVSAFHLVEHIGFDMVRALIEEALRALRPGGLLIMETPNPENLSVGANSFYLDPSHHQPIPPTLLDFAVEYAGFARHKVLRLQENEVARSGQRPRLIDVLEGTSSDYAVVAQKAAAPALLQAFALPFAADYGITLAMLAERYDHEAERVRSLDRQEDLAYVQRLAAHHEAELRQASNVARAYVDDALAPQVAKTADLEARLVLLEQHLVAITTSTSWRITAPMRWVGSRAKRGVSALRDGRLVPGLKRRAVPVLVNLMRAALRRPKVKQALRTVLRRFPGVQARLYGVLTRSTAQAAADAAPQQYGELSPRALRMYEQLHYELKHELKDGQKHALNQGLNEPADFKD